MHATKSKQLIIFLIPPEKLINGGVMSIFSLCKESRRFYDIHHSDVVISVYPGYESYRKNDFFENEEYIYDFDEALKSHGDAHDIMLHIPEYAVKEVVQKLQSDTYRGIDFAINILNQNIKYMPELDTVSSLFSVANSVTQTIAHNRYATQEVADHYAIPTHLLSVYLDQSQYKQIPYGEKTNTILYSPDGNPEKEKVLETIRKRLPNYDLVEIIGLTYSEYKKAIAHAKFVITFGEGFDGYLIESSMSGTIPITVYNDDFFPDSSYMKLPGIYATYADMINNIADDIASYDSKKTYTDVCHKVLEKIIQVYKYESYVDNLKRFYEKHYSFIPSRGSLKKMIGAAAQKKDVVIRNNASIIEELRLQIETLIQSNHEYKELLQDTQNKYNRISKAYEEIISSRSWRLLQSTHRVLSKIRKAKRH